MMDVRTQRRVHDAKLRARSGKFSLLFARAYATVNRARRYSSPRWRSYRACKLFNIRLYATLCFNYFWWHRRMFTFRTAVCL